MVKPGSQDGDRQTEETQHNGDRVWLGEGMPGWKPGAVISEVLGYTV